MVVVMPAGKTSVKAAPFIIEALGLVRVKVMVEVPPAWMVAGLKVLAMVTGPSTSRDAVAGDPGFIDVSVLVAPLVVLV